MADPRAGTAAKAETNFEYDDNEWDIGIGDLIIDLDADIEKTDEKSNSGAAGAMASSAPAPNKGKLSIEHSATVDKGLKMKIKRTKPGTKSSEVKHEIVKSGEQQNGNSVSVGEKHGNGSVNSAGVNAGVKRGSSGHRRDKAREKHEVNGVVRPNVQRVVFPVTVSGPGPPPSDPPPVPSPAPATPPTPQPPPALPPPPTLEEPKVPQSAAPPPPPAPPPAPALALAPASPPAVPAKKPKPSPAPSDISKVRQKSAV